MNVYAKRLIEVDLPIARISAHARREKSIRHGHISTLHIWWARRPLAACRAVICAALWPDPADPLCPAAFREAAAVRLAAFAKRVYPERITEEGRRLQATASPESSARWQTLANGGMPPDLESQAYQNMLRFALLDFIGDFANWDHSTEPAYLETARTLTLAAHEALGGAPGTRPLVVDPFAGGGSIPLEALRIGADAFASDLNPVAVLLNKVVLEYIPRYGERLADEVRKWGVWIKERAEKELAEFYPKDPDGATPVAYLWARTILSEAPGEEVPVEVPLLRSLWLCRKAERKIAIRWIRDSSGSVKTETIEVHSADGTIRTVRRPLIEVFEPARDNDVERGTVARGSATCPVTGFTTPVTRVRAQLKMRRGGTADSRLYCVVLVTAKRHGRAYRSPTQRDEKAASAAAEAVAKLTGDAASDISVIPDEEFTGLEPRRIPVPQYGMTKIQDLFAPRQLLCLTTLVRLVQSIIGKASPSDSGLDRAIVTCLAFAVDRSANQFTSLSKWHTGREIVDGVFARQAIPMLWDFGEIAPFTGTSGYWIGAIEWVSAVIERECQTRPGVVAASSATKQALPDDVADACITDPPYYFSVPYADLSDFFYVWLRRMLREYHPEMLSQPLTPKGLECVQNLYHSEVAHLQKDRSFYERTMSQALAESRRVTRASGVSVVVFAHTDTDAWESLLTALVDAGWCVTGSWPIDTELGNRVLAQRQSTLASSVHLACRPRENPDGTLREEIGEWRDILGELPRRIREWMPRLASEGVVGADAIFACLGPALEIFSRYSRVEKASGEAATLREYLEHVWAAVSTEALSMIFKDADAAGLEPDARLTAMWLWTLGSGGGAAGAAGEAEDAEESDVEEDDAPKLSGKAAGGYVLEFDAARKISQGLGIYLEKSERIVEVKGDKARLLPVGERTRYLFGTPAAAAAIPRTRKRKPKQGSLFEELAAADTAAGDGATAELKSPPPGATVLDRVHQAMILFAAGRGEALRRFLVEGGAGADARFWRLAQSLSALYQAGTDEKRWVDGVLARKKGLGL